MAQDLIVLVGLLGDPGLTHGTYGVSKPSGTPTPGDSVYSLASMGTRHKCGGRRVHVSKTSIHLQF